MADSSNPYKLSAEDHEKVYQRIQRKYLSGIEPQEQPKAIITGGQPGSGKSGLVDQAQDELLRRGGYVLVDADKLRTFHPRYQEALKADDTTAANLTHPDAGMWASRLARDAIAARLNVILDQTSRDPVALKTTADNLHGAGYEIDLRVMATREEVSWQRVHTRYRDQKAASGHGRFSTRDKHDEAYEGVAAAVEAAEKGKFVRAIGVYDLDHKPLHRAELRNGEWNPNPGAARAMLAERSRPLRPDETRALVDQYDRLAAKTHEQRGTQEEQDTIQQLRTKAVQLDKASHLRFVDPQESVERHPDLAGSYAMLHAIEAKTKVAGLTAEQSSMVVERSRQNIAISIEHGHKLPSVELVEATRQDRKADPGLSR